MPMPFKTLLKIISLIIHYILSFKISSFLNDKFVAIKIILNVLVLIKMYHDS